MTQAFRYFGMAIAMGMISYWASESMFWSFPPQDITPQQWAITVIAYSGAAACALSAVIWSGLGGWKAVFLGGGILGFIVEGVIVSTMYDALPFQLVWTPLAWHALVTGLGLFGMHFMMAEMPAYRHALALGVLGLGGGFFAGYWPLERATLPSAPQILLYHLGTGAAAALGCMMVAQLGRVPRPSSWVLLVVPVLAAALWVFQGIYDPRAERLTLLPMLGLTLWAMWRFGQSQPIGDALSVPQPPLLRHMLVLIAPLVTALIAAFAVRGTSGFAANIVAASTLAPLGLGLWLWLLWQAFRQPSAEPPSGR